VRPCLLAGWFRAGGVQESPVRCLSAATGLHCHFARAISLSLPVPRQKRAMIEQLSNAYRPVQCPGGQPMQCDTAWNVLAHEASRRSRARSLRLALAAFFAVTALAACGASGTSSPAVATTPSATAAPLSTSAAGPGTPGCPTAATVGSALGITLPAPAVVHGGGGTPLPAGATGVACEYRGQSLNVIIELIRNISPSYIAQFSTKFPVTFTSVSGVGDQARSFSVSLGGAKDNEGVVATKGSTLVDIVATATPASLSQLESLVRQLL
jgi:hypothetical protein